MDKKYRSLNFKVSVQLLKLLGLKSLSVNKPNSLLRFGRFSTNSLATLTSGSLSTRGLLEFKIESELNLRCFIVDRSHVLILLAIEKDLSGVTVVVPLTNTTFTMETIFGISDLLVLEMA